MSMSMMEVDQALKQLRLSGMRATLETRIIEAQVSNLPFVETFSAILMRTLQDLSSRYQIVDPSGKSSTLKLPLQVKWDKVEDLKVNVRPMLPGTYQITIMAEDFSGHVGVAKATTTN